MPYGLRVLLCAVLTWVGSLPVSGQDQTYWPDARYDSRIPTIKTVLGYQHGECITPHAGLMRYLEALAAAAPDRMRLFEYAKSWEGRKLVYAFIGSPENIRRLDTLSEQMQRLADPRRISPAAAASLIAGMPAIACLSYGVHGNEISPPDAALLTAYHLLAAQDDPVVDAIRRDVIVMIDPTQNPDGRDRFVHHFEVSEGIEPDASPLAAEHNEPWPGGRTNHYYFDLNRDWFALTQPETRGRVRVLQQYYPVVFVDLHEMGSESTYYFAPEAVPYNPHLAREQRQSLTLFGQNNAKWFDRFGFSYFTREVYDAFYPGYGASWPSYYGSVAMTYEQASARGLIIRRSDGVSLRFQDGIRHHFVASIATLETAAKNREKLLRDFHAYRQSAIDEGSMEAVKAYILPRQGNVSAVDKLVSVLDLQGVEVSRAEEAFRAAGRQFAEGSYVIFLNQPAKRLIRTLMDTDVPMEESFVREQERRRGKRLGDQIYDVTAWSLPLMYNVECVPAGETPRGRFTMVKPASAPEGRIVGGRAKLAYLAPWGTQAAGRFLAATLRAGVRVHSADLAFVQNERAYPSGTLILKVSDHDSTLHETVERLARSTGAEIHATDTGWVERGPNFGSGNVVFVPAPRIAIAWDQPTGSNSAGAARFVLERQFGYPLTPIRVTQLANADLKDFHALLIPEGGNYASALGENGIRNIKEWVRSGGVVISLGSSATSFLTDEKTDLLDSALENLAFSSDKKKEEKKEDGRVAGRLIASQKEYLDAIKPDAAWPDAVPGALLRARLDPDHWLAAGTDTMVYALLNGANIFTPLTLDKGYNAAVYTDASNAVASGYIWEENRRQAAFKPLLMEQQQGRGLVIGFTSDPNFRGYMDGLNILLLNAVFRGPAHANPQVTE